MSDTPLWIDSIYELVSLDMNPVGKTINVQINIITKLALLISAATSITNKNTASLKRTIAFISFLMVVYILVNCTKIPETDTPGSTTEPSVALAETFKVDVHNPMNNRQLSSSPELSSPATGNPQGSLVTTSIDNAKILGCSLDTDDWSKKTPAGDDTKDAAGKSLVLSPEIEAALTHNIPMDPSDEFYGSNFSRQIYKVADDQGNYANELYNQGPSQHCKQGSVFAYLGNPYTVYTKECTKDNGYGQSRRSGLYLPAKK